MTDRELEQIYNESYKAVYWTAMQLLKNEADAEDVVQDTFISFIENYFDIKDTTKATALLKKIAANKCLNRIKLAKTDNADDEFFDNVEAVPEDFLPDTLVESEAMRKIIMDIIGTSLSEDVRRTLILFYFDEMSTKEIAECLGIPQGSVLRRLNFARNKIKKEVEKYEKENNTKLFSMAIPFLSKLFIKESEQVAFKPIPAKLMNLSASAKVPAQGAGTKVAASAASKGTGTMVSKIVIGSVAAVVLTGAAAAGIMYYLSQNADTKPGLVTSEEESIQTDDGTANNATVNSDGSSAIRTDSNVLSDPNAAVIAGVPVVNGHEINLPCTVADLKSIGFDLEDGGVVGEGSFISMCYDGPDDYYAFFCYLDGDKPEGSVVSDNDQVVAVELFMENTALELHGVQMGMDEKDFGPLIGIPALVSERPFDYGNYKFYRGDTGLIYEFYFMNITDNSGNLKLDSQVFGTEEYMTTHRRLAEEI